MRTKNTPTRRAVGILSLAVLLLVASGACVGSSTPPGANTHLGTFGQAGYLFLRWEEGLEVMIWYDVTGSAMSHSAGSTQDDVYVERGSARSADGRSFEWEVQTRNGRTGEVRIDGAPYDLDAGNVFLVRTWSGTTDVRQLQRDLSVVPLNHDAIVAFAAEDPVLLRFAGAGPTPD